MADAPGGAPGTEGSENKVQTQAGSLAIGPRRGIIALLPRGGFLRGASLMVAGTVAGQAAVILSSPLLTRLYSPGEFGVLAVYAAVLAFGTSLATLRYEIAIPLPKGDAGATVVMALSLAAVLLWTGIAAVAVHLLGPGLVAWANVPDLAPYLWALPVGVLITGAHASFTYWGLRKQAFKLIAWTRLQQGGSMAGSQALFGFLNWGAGGLIAGHLLGLSSGLLGLARFRAASGPAWVRRVTAARLFAMARRYRDLPLYSSWGSIINTVGLQLPVMLFAGFYSPVVVGFYMLGQRVANAPVALVSEAVGKVFFVSAVEAQRGGRLPGLATRVFETLAKACLIPLTLLAVAAPELFAVVFGREWQEAGRYLQWLAAWIAASFVFVPMLTLFAVLQRHRADLAFQCTLVLVRLACICAGAALGGPLLAVALFSCGSACVYAAFGGWLLHAAGVGYAGLLRTAALEAAVAGAVGASLAVVKYSLRLEGAGSADPAVWAFLAVAAVLGALSLLRTRHSLQVIREMSENGGNPC